MWSYRIAFWPLRVFFALLLLATGTGKLLDVSAFADVIATYELPVPEEMMLPLGVAITLFELGLAAWMIAGIRLRSCAGVVIAMHVGYTMLAATTLVRGLELESCGCFGIFLARPLTSQTVLEDATLVALGIVLYLAVVARDDNQGRAAATNSW